MTLKLTFRIVQTIMFNFFCLLKQWIPKKKQSRF